MRGPMTHTAPLSLQIPLCPIRFPHPYGWTYVLDHISLTLPPTGGTLPCGTHLRYDLFAFFYRSSLYNQRRPHKSTRQRERRKMNATGNKCVQMMKVLVLLLAVALGAKKNVAFTVDMSGVAPTTLPKGESWTPTKAQARAAILRMAKSARLNHKAASGFPTKPSDAGLKRIVKDTFTPSAATGSVGILAYHCVKLQEGARRAKSQAIRAGHRLAAQADGGLWIGRGAYTSTGFGAKRVVTTVVAAFHNQSQAAKAVCRAVWGADWHETDPATKKARKAVARSQTARVGFFSVSKDGQEVSADLSEGDLAVASAQAFGFKGKSERGAHTFLNRLTEADLDEQVQTHIASM